ncbi:hypothetical protein E6O75_ATG06648 [Venturia nashicola]|uniref:Uncharacterized protein n=1 Tax=Venturia nashicola TaxID=86259 RepID=A0A4Z1NVK0_9PEZI|nr:hypothetical protein E6O75_ATG06648 [Venturia nashicola]
MGTELMEVVMRVWMGCLVNAASIEFLLSSARSALYRNAAEHTLSWYQNGNAWFCVLFEGVGFCKARRRRCSGRTIPY